MLPESIQSNPFLCSTIQDWIHQNQSDFDKFRVSNVSCWVPPGYKDPVQSAIRFFLKECGSALVPQSKQTIHFYLYPSPIQKGITPGTRDITHCEINSATTTFYEDRHEIVIWRGEEWKKVLFHELIHAFRLDQRMLPINRNKDKMLRSVFPHYNETPHEIYAETLATLLHMKFTNQRDILRSRRQSQLVGFGRRFTKLSSDEESGVQRTNTHLAQQIAKIVHHLFDGDTSDFFSYSPSIVLTHDTNAASYLVMKSIYFWNIQRGVDTFGKKPGSLDDLIRPFLTPDARGEFYDIFLYTLTSKRTEYMDWIRANRNGSWDKHLLLSV